MHFRILRYALQFNEAFTEQAASDRIASEAAAKFTPPLRA